MSSGVAEEEGGCGEHRMSVSEKNKKSLHGCGYIFPEWFPLLALLQASDNSNGQIVLSRVCVTKQTQTLPLATHKQFSLLNKLPRVGKNQNF